MKLPYRISNMIYVWQERCRVWSTPAIISDEAFLSACGRPVRERAYFIAQWRLALKENSLIPRSVLERSPHEWRALLGEEALQRICRAADEFLRHSFDLAGSGPVRPDYALEPKGVEDYTYRMRPPLSRTQAYPRRLKDMARATGIEEALAHYEPIDWHRDFKSGYRWPERVPFIDIPWGHMPGADVIVPWELSRFQHAVRLGQAYRITRNESYAKEIIAEILDWISSNPYGRGINWYWGMDVMLRSMSWAVALSLIYDSPSLSDEFLLLTAKALYQHSLFAVHHLEKPPRCKKQSLRQRYRGDLFCEYDVSRSAARRVIRARRPKGA